MSGGVQNNGLPAHWHWETIGEVARTQSGGTPDRHRSDYFGGNVRWVKSGELRDGFVASTEETLSQEGLAESSAKLLPAGTLCIALYGATVGKVGIVTTDAATNQAVCGIRVPDHVDTRFLFHYLIYVRPSLIQQRKGGAQGNISNSLVRKTGFPCPPLDEQQRIVAKIEELFSDLDAGVAALERVQANLQRYRASVLKAAVEGRLTQQWRAEHPDVEPADQLLQRILRERREKWEQDQLAKYEAKGKKPPKNWKDKYKEPAAPNTERASITLPKGWRVASLEQVTDPTRVICYGILKPKEHVPAGVPYVKVKDIIGDRIDVDSLNRTAPEIAQKYERASLAASDILLAIRGTYGRVAPVPPELNGGNITQDTARLAITRNVNPDYVELCLRSPLCQYYFQRVARGVAVKGVNIGDVKPCPIALPPINEQRVIVEEVNKRLSVLDQASVTINRDIARAPRLRQAILKRAFEGKLLSAETKTAASG